MHETLRAIPGIERIEAQLIPFGCGFERRVLAELGFRHLPAAVHAPRAGTSHSPAQAPLLSPGLVLERWDDRQFAACARLIQLAYANHTDGEINDQYRSESGP
jgi:hypothetical protein